MSDQQLPTAVTYFGMHDCVVELSMIALAYSAAPAENTAEENQNSADNAVNSSTAVDVNTNNTSYSGASPTTHEAAVLRAAEQYERFKPFIEANRHRFSDDLDLQGVFTRAAITQYFRFRNGGADRLPAIAIGDDLAALEKDLFLNTRNKGVVHDVNHCFVSYLFAQKPKVGGGNDDDSDVNSNGNNWDSNVFELSRASSDYLSVLSDLAIYSANHFLKENPSMARSIGKAFNQRWETQARFFFKFVGERKDYWKIEYPAAHRRITLEHLQTAAIAAAAASGRAYDAAAIESNYKTLLTANANLYDLRRSIAALDAILALEEDKMVTSSTEGLLFAALSCEFFNGFYRAIGTGARLNAVTEINTTEKDIIEAYALLKAARNSAMHDRSDGPLACGAPSNSNTSDALNNSSTTMLCSVCSSRPASPAKSPMRGGVNDSIYSSGGGGVNASMMSSTSPFFKADIITKWWPEGKRYQTIRRIVNVMENLIVGTDAHYNTAKAFLMANVDAKALAEAMALNPAPLEATFCFKDEGGKARPKEMWSPPEEKEGGAAGDSSNNSNKLALITAGTTPKSEFYLF